MGNATAAGPAAPERRTITPVVLARWRRAGEGARPALRMRPEEEPIALVPSGAGPRRRRSSATLRAHAHWGVCGGGGGGLCVRMRSGGAVIENWRRVGALFFVTSCRGGRASFLRRAEAIKEKREFPTISQIIQN